MKNSVVVPDALRLKAEKLRALHHGDRPLVLANAWDAASARLFEEAGDVRFPEPDHLGSQGRVIVEERAELLETDPLAQLPEGA